jgi:preprotein translocase subunit SecE
MSNIIKRIKSSIKSIHWPNCKEVVFDTLFAVVITVILSSAIGIWLKIIEHAVNTIMVYL